MCCSRRRQRLLEQQRQQRGRITTKPPVVRETSNSSIASSAINSALRFPSPARSPQQHNRDLQADANAEVLERAGIQPPSYESVMTESKPEPQASSSKHQEVDAHPDNVTVFSEDPIMYTPPTTRAPTVIFDHDQEHNREHDDDVDSVMEEFRRWQSRQTNSASSISSVSSISTSKSGRAGWREIRRAEKLQRREERRRQKDQRKAEKAARKAEKWAERAVRKGHVFEPNWLGSKAAVGVGA